MNPGFHWPLRVYYEDTDAGGIVFYANYLKFFERARTEWLRAAGINQQMLAAQEQRIFVVKSTAIDYHAPAKLDDRLEITVSVKKLGRASVEFMQEAWCTGHGSGDAGPPRLLCSGGIRVGCVDALALRPAPIPASVHACISRFAGTSASG
ncbi:MAG: tol-pal system-associated acyl-CoA thioesterase [Pseudomonadota bacterium]|jgi:acyl-CoA thioester hydrolase